MIKFLTSATGKDQFPDTEKEIVFVGRSNVGKSSLINALYRQKLAYVGKTPGKTRLINFFDINGIYTAVDVPGYGYARRSEQEALRYAQMMDDYFSRTEKIRLVVMITDVRIGLTADDRDMKDYLVQRKIPYVIVANKTDKLSNNQLNNQKRKCYSSEGDVIYVSAEKKKNMDQLEDLIAGKVDLPL